MTQSTLSNTTGGFKKHIVTETTSHAEKETYPQTIAAEETERGNLLFLFQRYQINVLEAAQSEGNHYPSRIYLKVGKVKQREDREFKAESVQGLYLTSEDQICQLIKNLFKAEIIKLKLDGKTREYQDYLMNRHIKEMVDVFRGRE
jgi:hypothetical protein